MSQKIHFVGFLRRFKFCNRRIHVGKSLSGCSKNRSFASRDLSYSEKTELLLQVAEECQTQAELLQLVKNKPNFICYDGFEPSGRMHVAQGLFKAINVNRCIDAGGKFVFWIADWFALMNDKMGGELQRIRLVGQYFVEVWKACGMKMDHVVFKWASQEINNNPKEYWKFVIDIAKRNSLARIKKCCQIMGRKEGNLSAAQILYPLMQCSDIFFLKSDICQLGLDQRKVNMLARDYCDQIGRKLKPIILSHHMIHGLTEVREEDGSLKKMSKSNPDSAIFMEDTEDDVTRKIFAAYCPRDAEIDSNPCLDYIRCIVLAKEEHFLGFESIDEVKENYRNGALSECDLKKELARLMNSYIEPVRKHFLQDAEAKKILSMVRGENLLQDSAKTDTEVPEALPHILAWVYPSVSIRMLEALQIVQCMNERVTKGYKATVLFSDWSSEALNCNYTGKEKSIDTLFQYTSQCLRSYGLDPAVKIVRQSELILMDADNYWLGVIEIGRKLSLSQLTDNWGSRGISLAGGVLAALMHINDMRISKATEIISYECPRHVACPSTEFSHFAISFLKNTFDISAQNQNLRNVDVLISCDDTPADIKRHINKLYAPLTETQANPLVELAEIIMNAHESHELNVSRDGGREVKKYIDIASIRRDYEDDNLHPGDLKTSLTKFLTDKTSVNRSRITSFLDENQKIHASLKLLRKK